MSGQQLPISPVTHDTNDQRRSTNGEQSADLPDAKEDNKRTRQKKRLIVLCDGTCQDSTADSGEYPTNVTRFARALSTRATVNGEEREQIVYYQKGVGGKGLRNLLFGGAFGLGLSANVRAAYGFLAHNYEEGDQIYFFGFSRGAYTARAIAGLVAGMGLLNKRGMDSFHKVYDEYYSHAEKRSTPKLNTPLIKELKEQKLFHPQSAQEAVEIVGVWDTVGFHQTRFAKLLDALRLSEVLGTKGEKIEFYNTGLSSNVRYGFHALALDEKRRQYRPTLWGAPDPSAQKKVAWNSMSSTSNTASGPGSPSSRLHEISQVWFSGAHSDIGGGFKDHRLSDISLAWMISQYGPLAKESGRNQGIGISWSQLLGRFTAAPRWPLAGQNADANATGEYIHRSIADRYFGTNKPQSATPWPCAQLTGANCASGWALRGGSKPIKEFRAGSVAELDEDSYNGCVRDADEDWKQVLARQLAAGSPGT